MCAELSPGFSRPSRLSRFVGKRRWLIPMLLLATAGAAHAADTFTVNSLTDDATGVAANCPANAVPTGTCTLRDAVTAANADANASTIQFSVTGTIVVSSTITINNSKAAVAISNQSGPGPIAISGNNAEQVLGMLPGTATLAYITIENGNGKTTTAGGIYNEGNLTLNNVVLQNNTTAAGIGGGGIYNAGTLTVNYSSFSGNSESITGSTGGAIRNASGATLTVNSSTFANNSAYQGGAIENDSTNALTITNSTFSGNTATYSASGIYSNAGAALNIYDSTFYGNKNGIAYGGSSQLNVYNSLFDASAECGTAAPASCPTSGSKGNVVAPTNSVSGRPAVLPLGNYGGPTQTLMPMPGSSAICAGLSADIPNGVTIDQRTFPFNNACADAGAVQTNYITITTGVDDIANAANCPGASCSFRDAVAAANAAFNGDIDFASGVSTVTLTAEGPTNLYNTNIIGPGAGSLTVNGQGANVLFGTFGGNVFMYGMTFANGYNDSDTTGGAIYNQTNLTVSNMTFTGNVATGYGGAIYTKQGGLTVLNSAFVNNTAPQGSALYNNTTNGPLVAEYSTFANNNATTNEGGAIFSAYGAPMSLYNTTLSGNTNTGIIFAGSSALVVENSVLDNSGECIADAPAACPTTGTLGNVVTPTNVTTGMPALSAPGSYSGTNTLYSAQSVLPEPGSSAICAGSSTLIPAGIATDQRGFSNENITYTGYSASKICVDAGAVQTNYTSTQFVGSPYTGTSNAPGATPPVIVSVTENGQNVGGVQVPLIFSGAGTASGTTATTVEGTGATFSSIEVNQPSGSSPDTLSISLPVVGTDKLAAGPVNWTVSAEIVPYIQDYEQDGGAWQNVASLTVNYGDTVNLGPQPGTGGTWSWTGPNGFTSTSRALNGIALPTGTNVYTATYTDPGGVKSTLAFTITIASTPITPYLEVNGGAWQGTNSVTVAAGSAVNLGPQAAGSGTWSWTGPSYSAATQQVNNVPLNSPSNVYTATFTNASGVKSTQTFTITVSPTSITPYIQVNGIWQAASSATVPVGSAVNLGPQAAGSGTWSWTGPSYSAATQQVNNVPLNSPSNVYTATFTNASGVTSTQTFTITVSPSSITPYIQVNGIWQAASSATVPVGSAVNLGPQAASSGTWSWTGPSYTASTQQVNNVPLNSPSNVFTATFTNASGVASTEQFTITVAPTSITPYIEVNGGAWQGTNNVTVAIGSSVNLGPQASGSGTWSWSGPSYTASTEQVNNVPLNSASNVYTVTFTNAAGVSSMEQFTITIAPTAITPYLQDYAQNGGAWQASATLTANYGDTVNLGPQASGSGTWSWSGPSSYSANTEQINNIPLNSASNVYTVTFTNAAGAISTKQFTITIAPSTITPYIEVNNGAWQGTNNVTVPSGSTVNLGPQAPGGGTWSWSGPSFTASTRQVNNVPLSEGSNTYTATYTNPAGVQSTETFVITVN